MSDFKEGGEEEEGVNVVHLLGTGIQLVHTKRGK